MEKSELIERIRKLFAMSQDTSSPAEAAIAARRCRSLMDEHGVTADDLERARDGSGTLGIDERHHGTALWIHVMALGVGEFNDCIAGSKRGGIVRFKGFDVDTMAAHMMLEYLRDAGESAVLKYRIQNGINDRTGETDFLRAFAVKVQDRLRQMAAERMAAAKSDAATGSPGALVIVGKADLVKSEFGAQKVRHSAGQNRNPDAVRAGFAAGNAVGLNPQVGDRPSQKQIGVI